MSTPGKPGVLYVVATPIGNLEDLSRRALRVLAEVDLICCEDTRRTGQLLSLEQIRAPRLVSLHAHNEASRIDQVVDAILSGSSVALVSDAGTPLVSDPGERLVRSCVDSEIEVIAVPGPSAVLAALVVAGFSLERFSFEGFLPRKGAARASRLEAIAISEHPVVCYESPQRIGQSIEDLRGACGDQREVAVCRELTKLHEEIWRGPLEQAPASPAVLAQRGEYVVVVSGRPEAAARPTELLGALFERLADAGLARRDAVAAVEITLGIAHREAYEAALGVAEPTRSNGGAQAP